MHQPGEQRHQTWDMSHSFPIKNAMILDCWKKRLTSMLDQNPWNISTFAGYRQSWRHVMTAIDLIKRYKCLPIQINIIPRKNFQSCVFSLWDIETSQQEIRIKFRICSHARFSGCRNGVVLTCCYPARHWCRKGFAVVLPGNDKQPISKIFSNLEFLTTRRKIYKPAAKMCNKSESKMTSHIIWWLRS